MASPESSRIQVHQDMTEKHPLFIVAHDNLPWATSIPTLGHPYHYHTTFCTIVAQAESPGCCGSVIGELNGKFHAHAAYHQLSFSEAITRDFDRTRIDS
jgi:hypothetical protein